MANEFLNTPLLPGAPVEPHIHHRLMMALIVVVVLILIILGVYYFIPAKPAAPPSVAPVVVDQRMQAINNSLAAVKDVPPASQAQIQASYKNLQKTAVPATQAEITNSLNQLKNR